MMMSSLVRKNLKILILRVLIQHSSLEDIRDGDFYGYLCINDSCTQLFPTLREHARHVVNEIDSAIVQLWSMEE